MAQGISPNPLNDISKAYLELVAKIHKEEEGRAVSQWDTTSKESINPDLVLKVSEGQELKEYNPNITYQAKGGKKSGKLGKSSLYSIRDKDESKKDFRKSYVKDVEGGYVGKGHKPTPGSLKKESFSNWRLDLREIVDEPEEKAEKEVKEKKVKNKVIINPQLGEAIAEIGGQLLEVKEAGEDPGLKSKEQRQKMLKKQVLMKKLQAVRQGGGTDITASYDPLEDAIEYFYEEGINEEGFDQLIEEIGLEEFVNFVDGGVVELTEERSARKASVRAKKYDVVKKEVDAADAARKKAKKGEYAPSYAKKETDVTVYDDKPSTKKKAAAKKPVAKKAAPKPAPKKAAPKPVAVKKPVTKKVVKAVAKVKKTQPAKKPSKAGLADRIRTAYKKGVERHKAAREKGRVPEKRAREFASGVKSGVKTAVKFAKDVKKVVSEEELLEKDLNAAERRALPNKDFVFPGKGEGPEGKQRGAYPIPDKKHARNALAMAAAHASPEKQAKVKAAVKKKFPGIKVSESRDKALDVVRAAIIKKHGKGAIYDPKRDKPSEADKKKAAAERKKRDADKAKAFASRAKKAGYKNPQDYANVVARYGSEDNYRKGKGLGT